MRALVQELIERMLAVVAGAAPDDRRRRVRERATEAIDGLAVALHVELLQPVGQQTQAPVIRQNTLRLGTADMEIPDAQQRPGHRQVILPRQAPALSAQGAGTGP